MAGRSLHVLLIQSWVVHADVVRGPLTAAGYEAQITRVDFEPALEAALARNEVDIVIYDESTPAMPRGLVDGKLREHGLDVPVVVVSPDLADAVHKALLRHVN